MTLTGMRDVAGIYGGSMFTDNTVVAVYFYLNSIQGTLNALENVGGIIGQLFDGRAFIGFNILTLTFQSGEFRIGGLVGAIADDTFVFVTHNIVSSTMMFDLQIDLESEFVSRFFIGGILGYMSDFSIGFFAGNRIQTTMEFHLTYGDQPQLDLEGISLYHIGGAIGSTRDSTIILMQDCVIETTLSIHHTFLAPNSDVDDSINTYTMGGIVGDASGENISIYVDRSRISFTVEQTFTNMGDSVSMTTHSLGGVVGYANGVSLELDYVEVTFRYHLNPLRDDSTNNRWSDVWMSHYALGGILGYSGSDTFNSIELRDVSLDIDFEWVMDRLPLVTSSAIYFVLRDTGGLVGYLDGSMEINAQFVVLNMTLSIDDEYLTLVSLLNQTSVEEGVLQLRNVAGLVGFMASTQGSSYMLFENVLVTMNVSNNVQSPFLFEQMYGAMGENRSLSINIIGINSFLYTSLPTMYGDGPYIYVVLQRVESESLWLDRLAMFAASSPLRWTIQDGQLIIRFLDSTLQFQS
jgi:hypothetical protein